MTTSAAPLTSSDALYQWKCKHAARLGNFSAVRVSGRVSAVSGILLECQIPAAKIGDLCEVSKADGSNMLAEIVGFTRECTLLSALGTPDGIQVGAHIRPLGMAHRIGVDDRLLGSVLDGFGRPLLGDSVGAFAGPGATLLSVGQGAPPLLPGRRERHDNVLPS